jgi:hypothetical protein
MSTGICDPYAVDYEKLIKQLNENPPTDIKILREDIRYLLNADEEEANKIIEILVPLHNGVARIAKDEYMFTVMQSKLMNALKIPIKYL